MSSSNQPPQPPRPGHWLRGNRSEHRAKSHAAAHGEMGSEADVPQMALVPRSAATLIATDGGLAELLEHLRSAGSFAYDSEFIGELSYVPKLCLIQVATAERVALIDPLAEVDKFARKFDVEYPLLADEDHAVCEAYGVWQEKTNFGKTYMGVGRTTFLIDAEGRVARVFEKVKPEGHAAEVLEAIRSDAKQG